MSKLPRDASKKGPLAHRHAKPGAHSLIEYEEGAIHVHHHPPRPPRPARQPRVPMSKGEGIAAGLGAVAVSLFACVVYLVDEDYFKPTITDEMAATRILYACDDHYNSGAFLWALRYKREQHRDLVSSYRPIGPLKDGGG
ncbi:MAG: hypothetical protein AAF661_05085 [Pseudomonadota bacterium]